MIGVGPGFTAGEDCHCVIETKTRTYIGKRDLSRFGNSEYRVPGDVGGYTIERLLKSTSAGVMEPVASIGDLVETGEDCCLYRRRRTRVCENDRDCPRHASTGE